MNLQEIKTTCMHQTGNDADDLEDYLPYLGQYINEGYDQIVEVWDAQHVDPESADYPPLVSDMDVPNVPSWIHPALANWGTYCLYRNGSAPKQQRALMFLRDFQRVLAKIVEMGGKAGAEATAGGDGKGGGVKNFFNIPR